MTAAGLLHRVLDEYVDTISGEVAISTMYLAKGLEFRTVAVMACTTTFSAASHIEAVATKGDIDKPYNAERQLLYVACTRARDSARCAMASTHLCVTAKEPASEFLDDLR